MKFETIDEMRRIRGHSDPAALDISEEKIRVTSLKSEIEISEWGVLNIFCRLCDLI